MNRLKRVTKKVEIIRKNKKTHFDVIYKKLTLKIMMLKAKGWRRVYHTNGEQQKSEVTISMSDKVDFIISYISRAK